MIRPFFVFIFILSSSMLSAQSAEVRTYGGILNEEGVECLVQDDGYWVLASSNTIDNGNSEIYLLDLNDDLTINQSMVFGTAGADEALSMCSDGNGGAMILSHTSLGNNGTYDVVVYRVDDTFTVISETHYGGENWDLGTKIVNTEDGFLVMGKTYSLSDMAELWLFEIDLSGTVINENSFSFNNDFDPIDLHIYNDAIYLCFDDVADVETAHLWKLSDINTFEWEYIKSDLGYWSGAIDSNDFGIIWGATRRLDNDEKDMMIFDLLDDGTVEWEAQSTADGNQTLTTLRRFGDNVIQVGTTDTFGAGGLGGMVERRVLEGIWIGNTVFGGEIDDEIQYMTQDANGRLIFVGWTNSYELGLKDIFFLRYSDLTIQNDYDLEEISFYDDLFAVGIDQEDQRRIKVYPNPVSDLVFIDGLNQMVEYEIVSTDGRVIKSGQTQSQIDLTNVVDGVYFLEIDFDPMSTRVTKIVVRH